MMLKPTALKKKRPSQLDTPPEAVACSLDRLLQFRNGADRLSMSRARQRSSSIRSGGHRSAARGRGMDFEEVRLYQPGDDIRHIDWRVTARTGQPHTKIFREERERPLFILVDQRLSMFFSSQRLFKSVLAAHLGALLAWQAFHRRDRVGGILFNDHTLMDLKPTGGKRGVLRFLHQLADINQQLLKQSQAPLPSVPESHPLIKALNHLQSVTRPGSLIYLISDFRGLQLDHYHQQQLFKVPLGLLSRHNDIHALSIHDPVEHTLPEVGLLGISNGTQRQLINTQQSTVRQKHQRDFTLQRQHLQEQLTELGISLSECSTAEEADKQIILDRS